MMKVLLWFFSEMSLILSDVGVLQWITWPFSAATVETEEINPDDYANPCSQDDSNILPRVRYFLCNVVVSESSNERFFQPTISNQHPCIMSMTRYTLNTTTVRAKKRFNGSLTHCGNCSESKFVSYTVHWLEPTNLIMVMAAANCECSNAKDTFVVKPQEVELSENETCQRLFNFSKELKRVDNTRDTDALCLDSRNEEDYTCGQSSLHGRGLVLSVWCVTLFTWLLCC